MLSLSPGVWHLLGFHRADVAGSIFCRAFGSGAAALPIRCPPGVLRPWYAAPSRGSLLEGSLALLPNVCFQGNAAGTQAGAAVEIWQRVPSVCNSSSRSTSPSRARRCGWELGPSGAAPKRGWHLGHLGWAGAGRQMQSDPNKPESVQVIPSLL